VAKAAPWTKTDAQVRKRGEQTGLDTLVVHAVNDVGSPQGSQVHNNESVLAWP